MQEGHNSSMKPAPFERHADLFVLPHRLNGEEMKAECQIWGHAGEWERRLHVAGRGVLASTAVPTVPSAMETGVTWKAAMTALGWRE